MHSPLLPPRPSRPSDDAARRGAGVLAVAEHLHAVDEDVHHARGVLMRRFERGVILDGRRVEDGDVGEVAGRQSAALADLEIGGGQRGQAADGLFERDDLLVARVFAQEPGEVTVSTRVRVRLQVDR